VLIAWLIARVEPEDASKQVGINNLLLFKFDNSVVLRQGTVRSQFILPKRVLDLLDDEDMGLLSPQLSGRSTQLSGTAYIDECRAIGVPIPPKWPGLAGSSEWTSKGRLDFTFISKDLIAEVFTYQSSSPRGVCFALPRYSATEKEIQLLGIICQGNDTSKACFWDNQENKVNTGIPKNEARELTRFAGGADLVGSPTGGICSDCHAGENAFNIHPGTPLQLGQESLLKPTIGMNLW